MDISMPIMDGYEATIMIRNFERFNSNSSSSATYIVGLTAHSTDAYKDKCFTTGMNLFSKSISIIIPILPIVTKPVEADDLVDVLSKVGLI
jgi:CheY-like chemotaxis protein